MNDSPLVSIIVPTKNNQRTIHKCIDRCVNQTYPNVEVIVIDNYSDDQTPKISEELGARVVTVGPERNLQRPAGAKEAKGDFVLFIDSDMYLPPTLIEDCMNQWKADPSLEAFILPEISIGEGFWTRCKILERKLYLHYPPLLTARLIKRETYDRSGGWDPELIAGEDFDLHERLESVNAKVGRSREFIEHDEGRVNILPYLKKKFYYGRFLKSFLKKSKARGKKSLSRNIFFLRSCFYTDPYTIIRHPLLYLGMFAMLFLTQLCYVSGMVLSRKS